MSIGYACLALGVPGSGMKNCIMKNANEELLLSLIGSNLDALERLITYNARNGIGMFRISSDLIPFGSSLAEKLPWQNHYSDKLESIGGEIRRSGMRVSMHPGQYTVLNSTDESVADRASRDLDYHAKVLDGLGLGPEHKMILHLGGVYGDKGRAKERFVSRYKLLDAEVKKRLVLENDDKLFNIEDVIETASATGMPAVYDNLHNAVNPADASCRDVDWIEKCRETWTMEDGPQKVHYSQQNPDKRPGAHSGSIRIDEFLDYYREVSGTGTDIMLEVKDKNMSALKCINCVSDRGIKALEAEWARYKYSVMERAPDKYHAIRKLLQDKTSYHALEMYHLIEGSLVTPIGVNNAVNAAQHVWGYLNDKATDSEKKRFHDTLNAFISGRAELKSVKNILHTLARKYQEDYLLNSYYFYI
ncbi:MAG: UV DNA damage repair endonuclease UvsE [Methanomassiliicoccaceae archaeon]|nr:UV DNA damage repair endonuclease UvsE [Methanomassiliicoccaceae archaeon]